MAAVRSRPQTKTMPFAVRPMEKRHVAQAVEIERDAFPTLFPPTSFRRELNNHRASYLVAWALEEMAGDRYDDSVPAYPDPAPHPTEEGRPLAGRVLHRMRNLWGREDPTSEVDVEPTVGFLGIWYVLDEAHIVTVGVRRDCRGNGIGELLLIAALEQAVARGSRVATLEVRVSNGVARNLYEKYGFTERGIRKAYYSNDREDAVIMTTDPISSSAYARLLDDLIKAHERRWGVATRTV